jgi:hypothetical protein
MTKKSKRNGGQLTGGGVFLVLTESTRQPDRGWVHNACGKEILSADVALSHRADGFPLGGSGKVQHKDVPYCPHCEILPVSGTFQDNGYWHIDTWETPPEKAKKAKKIRPDLTTLVTGGHGVS